ncbi:hypothetical protein RvY_04084-2 [Ramazzottius varieornatus]|nr:hypothetical protein RvY_04084-2 [Ramazzottius varieornatus]
MTDGKHVFMSCGIQGVPAQDAVYWRADDGNDEMALQAFQSLLIISDGVVDWNGSTDFLQQINDLFAERYGWHVPLNETNNDGPIRTYEMFLIFSDVFRRTWENFGSMTIADFVMAFANHTYDLPTRSVYLDPVGTMIALVPVKRLNATTAFYDTVLRIHPKTGEMIVLTDSWFDMTFLPGDFPLCGDHGEKCFVTRSPDLFIAIVVVAVFVVLLLCVGFWAARRKYRKRLVEHLMIERSAIEETYGTKISRNWSYRNQEVELMKVTSSTEQNLFGNSRHPLYHIELQSILIAVSQLSHPNIATFYGLTFDRTEWYAVFEADVKGTLATVLSTNCDSIFFDFDIRMVFATSLIEGLYYIHHSPVHYHGHLTPEVCLMNNRYTLRITGVGTTRLQNPKKSNSHFQYQNKDVHELGAILQCICADIQEIPISYLDIISKCHATPAPSASIAKIRSEMDRMFPRQNNIVDLLLSRLGKHAQDLEETVHLRSEELGVEMGKVDLLLREMLPA